MHSCSSCSRTFLTRRTVKLVGEASTIPPMTGYREWICNRGRMGAIARYLTVFLLLKEQWCSSTSAAFERSNRSGAGGRVILYVRPPDPATEGRGSGESIVGLMEASDSTRAGSATCGSEDNPCPDIRRYLMETDSLTTRGCFHVSPCYDPFLLSFGSGFIRKSYVQTHIWLFLVFFSTLSWQDYHINNYLSLMP